MQLGRIRIDWKCNYTSIVEGARTINVECTRTINVESISIANRFSLTFVSIMDCKIFIKYFDE